MRIQESYFMTLEEMLNDYETLNRIKNQKWRYTICNWSALSNHTKANIT